MATLCGGGLGHSGAVRIQHRAMVRRTLKKLFNKVDSRVFFSQYRYIVHILRSDWLTFFCVGNDAFGSFPNGLMGNFQIYLTGEPIPVKPDPPVILQYNVRLQGDDVTADPVIIQNTWTAARDWGEEKRCPSPGQGNKRKVDDLKNCSDKVGKDDSKRLLSLWSPKKKNSSRNGRHFPFEEGLLSGIIYSVLTCLFPKS